MSDLAIKHEKHSDNEEDSDDETEGADEIIDTDSETGKDLNDRAVHGDQDEDSESLDPRIQVIFLAETKKKIVKQLFVPFCVILKRMEHFPPIFPQFCTIFSKKMSSIICIFF